MAGSSSTKNFRKLGNYPGIVLTREDEHHFRNAKLVWRIPDFGKLSAIVRRDESGPEQLASGEYELLVAAGRQGPRLLKMFLILNWNRSKEELKDFISAYLYCQPLLNADGTAPSVKIATEFVATMGSKTVCTEGSLHASWSVYDRQNLQWGFSHFINKKQLEKELKESGMNETLVVKCNVSIFCKGPPFPPAPTVATNLSLAEQMWANRDEGEVTIMCPLNVKFEDDDDGNKDGKVGDGAKVEEEMEEEKEEVDNDDKKIGKSADSVEKEEVKEEMKKQTEMEKEMKSFKCHKAVLCSRSKVFAAMFNHEGTPEHQSNTIKIKDIDSDTMEQFIEFIYKDTCWALKSGFSEIELVVKLLMAADKYDLGPMKTSCEKLLSGIVCADSLAGLGNLALCYDGRLLMAAVVDFAAAHFDEVISRRGWEEMDRKVLDKILDGVHMLRLTS